MDEKSIEDFFLNIKDPARIEFIKSKLGVVKKIENQNNKTDINLSEDTFFEPKEEFRKYLEYKEKYHQAESKLNSIKRRAQDGDTSAIHELSISGSLHDTLIKAALNSWIVMGYKNEIEKIINQY
ncbi:hypothetical protein [Flavobacterium sp.]|uniref:hypothetical protein n=1 Tax=Flavobacterium sp. TaxID=239 RepID=UPI002602F732|nr:hypothetical protein [Flavobacterium sp.]